MNIENVDIQKLWDKERDCRTLFQRWTQTAIDAAPERLDSILIVRNCYADVPPSQYSPMHLKGFVETLLNALPNADTRRAVLHAEALECLK